MAIDRLVAAAGTGQLDERALKAVLWVDGSVAGKVLKRGRPERIVDVVVRLGVEDERMAIVGAETALLVPLRHRDRAVGVLCAFDRLDENPRVRRSRGGPAAGFRRECCDSRGDGAVRRGGAAAPQPSLAEQERGRWARELHDETLQGLAAMGVLPSSGLKAGGDSLEPAARQAAEHLATEVANLRALITELRPAALDELGLVAALEGLARRVREVEGLEVVLDTAVDE
jgi:signal transduction histidine kinase